MIVRFCFMAAAAVACALTLVVASAPARAQFGPLFGDPPPRPPGGIPRGLPPPSDDDEEVPELPQGRLLPTPQPPPRPAPGQSAPPPGAFQSQPLPPPPGVAPAQPQQQQAAPQPPTPAAPPIRGTKGTPPPVPATLQPGDEVVTEPPASKIVNKKAVFSGLDKITGRIISFDADIGETVQFGALRVKPDACYTRSASEAANTDSFVEVDEITLQGEVKRIFSGWMFAASPGLHGVEHPIYDIWLTDCKGPEQTIVSTQPDAKPAPAKQPPRNSQSGSSQSRQTRNVTPPPGAPPPPPPVNFPPFTR